MATWALFSDGFFYADGEKLSPIVPAKLASGEEVVVTVAADCAGERVVLTCGDFVCKLRWMDARALSVILDAAETVVTTATVERIKAAEVGEPCQQSE